MIHFWTMIEINVFGNIWFFLRIRRYLSDALPFLFFLFFHFVWFGFSFLSVFHNDFVVLYNFFPLNLFRPKWLMVLRITSILLYRANVSIYYKCFLCANVYEHCVWFGGRNIYFSVCLILCCKFDINFPWKMCVRHSLSIFSVFFLENDTSICRHFSNVNRFLMRILLHWLSILWRFYLNIWCIFWNWLLLFFFSFVFDAL